MLGCRRLRLTVQPQMHAIMNYEFDAFDEFDEFDESDELDAFGSAA